MAGGEAVLARLTHPEVADFLIRGARFIKWDEDSTVGLQCTVKVDPAAHLIYWRAEDKETDLLELTSIRDIRTGKSAKIPKDKSLRDSLKIGGSEEDSIQDKTITIVYGSTLVDIYYVNFVAPGSVNTAREWADALFCLTHNLLAINASPISFLEKLHSKICVQTSGDGKIPVKNILKYVSSSKEDKKRVLDTLQSVGLPHGKNDTIAPDKFSFEEFWAFYSRLCDRKDIDKIFAEIGAKKKPYLTVDQLVEFLNNEQRDPRLNEILFPYCTSEKAQAIIDKYEPNRDFAKKGHFSVQGLTRYLMSDDNFIINHDRLSCYQDMTQPLSHYFINSSHNTYLTGHQLTGKSSVEMYRQALLAGCRCIELDCWDGKDQDQEPVITHGMTMCTQISFKDVIEAIAECAFKTSEYPVILSFENHCSPKQQAKMAAYCVSIFADMLLNKPLDDFPLEEGKGLPPPKALLRKIVIKNKKRPSKREEGVDVEKTPIDTTAVISSDTKVEKVDGEITENGGSVINEEDVSKADQEEVAPEVELSALVNYIQPVHFKSFETSEKLNRSYEMSSFVENNATALLKESPVEFVNYNKRQLSRIYPSGTRVGSANYMPQIFWNAGCQLVALNYQTLDLPMMLNQGIFEYNGRCGYILKPSFMCRADKSFDPFAESTVDGIIAGAVTVRVISGQWLTEKKVGTYVEVDMYGLPADTVRRKYKTKIVPNNTINPVYDEEPFVFKKVVLPSLAVLRIALYEESGKLIGQRILPVVGLSPGYRHIKLRNESNQPLCLPTLFVHIVTKDYVPSGFEDFANALCDPIAYHQEEKRQQQLQSLLDDEEMEEDAAGSEAVVEDGGKATENAKAKSAPGRETRKSISIKAEKKSIKRNCTSDSLVAEINPLNQRRGSEMILREALRRDSSRDSISGIKPLQPQKSGNPHAITSRSLSLQAAPVTGERGPFAKRSRSTKKREGSSIREENMAFRHFYTKVEPASVRELKERKPFLKLNQKHQKEMDILVKRHEKDKDKLQKNHLLEQEKTIKDLDKEKVSSKKKSDKELKKAEKKGNYEESYRKGVEGLNNLAQSHEIKVQPGGVDKDSIINTLKRQHRDSMVDLLKRQLNEQLELAEKQLLPKQEELEKLMRLSQEEKMKSLADLHAKQMNELRKSQDNQNREELKVLARQHSNKDELQRRKREENKKHIEQSVKERQKMTEFHKKESEELEKEHDKLYETLDEDRKKSSQDLRTLHETKVRQLSVCDLEITYASLYGDKVTKL
ncbi:1-phosphatidylinositol 4,5-bisphosphate phosphodiesterase beta-1-like isoform X2 [Pocillopora verrucosa]|uniref:1-phosphatidylinositol 4,5-bisphosphate phosphodiesterase beta-1-like isoform X2 n=1 Tax=Pocillopora verrucosa TaxID=203993 RepID=UPI00334103BA